MESCELVFMAIRLELSILLNHEIFTKRQLPQVSVNCSDKSVEVLFHVVLRSILQIRV